MPTYGFSLNAEAATYNSLTISVTTASTGTSGETFTVAAEVSGTVVTSATVTTGAEGESVNAIIMGLSPSTTYTITGKINESPAATSITASTIAPSSDPRTATEAQWQDLAARVKAKADSSAVPSTYWGQTASNGAVTGDLTLTTDAIHGDAEITSGATLQDGVSVSLTAGGSDIITARRYTDVQSQVSISTIELGGTIDAGFNKINNLAAGTASTDAVNKSQLDAKATITMQTTDPGEGSALSANNYVAVYGGDPIIMDYSTSEINTGAKWINGSAIYKKTINIGTVNTNSSAVIAHNISSFATFIKSEAWGSFGTPSTGYFWFAIPWSGSNYVSLTVDETNVTVASTIGNNITSCYVTLYYTKNS